MPGSEIVEEKHPVRKFLWSLAIFCLIVALNIDRGQTPETVAPVEIQNRYENISAYATTSFMKNFEMQPINTNVEYFIDPEINDDEKIMIYRNVDQALKFLGSEFRTKDLFVYVFSSRNWGRSQLTDIATDENMKSWINEDFDIGGQFEQKDCDVDYPTSAGLAYVYWGDPVIAIDASCGFTTELSGERVFAHPELITHEITHAAQETWFGENFANRDCFMPRWFSEGQAEFVSVQTATTQGELDPEKFRMKWLDYQPNTVLTDDESFEQDDSQGPYSDGAFAIEYLVGKHGWKKMEQFMALLVKNSTDVCTPDTGMTIFSPAFKSVYKQSISDFYDEVRSYISWNVRTM
jgi:hypothetical protein